MEKDHAKRDEYTARCLRRRTSPWPCWIPLAAVDQNYKAEQRFGTSVRDPRRDILSFLLILALSSSRSNGMVSIGFPNTFERSCFSHPALLSPTPRETIRGFAGGVRWRISRVAFLHLLRHVPLEKGGLASWFLYGQLSPAGGLGDASKTCSSFTRRVALHTLHTPRIE